MRSWHVGDRERDGHEQDKSDDHGHDHRHHHARRPRFASVERVSSAMCAEASKPVMVYCAISSPIPNTYQNTMLLKPLARETGVVDRLAEHEADRLMVVGDDDQE